jgi:hypothetical protein
VLQSLSPLARAFRSVSIAASASALASLSGKDWESVSWLAIGKTAGFAAILTALVLINQGRVNGAHYGASSDGPNTPSGNT